MGTMVKRDGLLALSFNVDYWDSLGWKDTLADPAFSRRQRAYAQARGDGQVYTPQVVVDGLRHVVGSDEAGIDADLTTLARAPKVLHTEVDVSRSIGGGARIVLPATDAVRPGKFDATIWLVAFEPRVEVVIQRGENSGKTIAYHNVVRHLVDVGHWTGAAATVDVAPERLASCKSGTCALIVQAGGVGEIVGASWMPGAGGT